CLEIAHRSRGHAAREADQQTLATVADRTDAAAGAGIVVDEAVALLLPPGAVERDLPRHDDALGGLGIRRQLDGGRRRADRSGRRGQPGIAADPDRSPAVPEDGDLADRQDGQAIRSSQIGNEEQDREDESGTHGMGSPEERSADGVASLTRRALDVSTHAGRRNAPAPDPATPSQDANEWKLATREIMRQSWQADLGLGDR